MPGVRKGLSMRYSGLKVITEGLFGNKGWKPAWRDPAPKAEYDAILIVFDCNNESSIIICRRVHARIP